MDLGSEEAKQWIGVTNPHRLDVLQELRSSTAARVCTGRAGPRPRTQALLRFLVAIGSWLLCGLGFFWVLWDKEKRSWHDIYSESQVVQLPKNIPKK